MTNVTPFFEFVLVTVGIGTLAILLSPGKLAGTPCHHSHRAVRSEHDLTARCEANGRSVFAPGECANYFKNAGYGLT